MNEEMFNRHLYKWINDVLFKAAVIIYIKVNLWPSFAYTHTPVCDWQVDVSSVRLASQLYLLFEESWQSPDKLLLVDIFHRDTGHLQIGDKGELEIKM